MARGGKRPGAGRKPIPPEVRAARAKVTRRVSKYDPSLCDEVERLMGLGYSLTAFAGKVGVGRSTINQWMKDYADFAEAVERAKCARLIHWEDAAMRVAESGGGPGTATIIVFGLKNMGGDDWADKTAVEHSGHIKTDDDSPRERINRRIAGLAQRSDAERDPSRPLQ